MAVPGVRLLSIFVLLPDYAKMNLSGSPCFENRCMSLLISPNGLNRRRRTLPSIARRLQSFASLQHSKLAFSILPYSILRSRSLLGGSCSFWCMIFLLKRSISLGFNLTIGSSPFFLSACTICRAYKKVILHAAIGNKQWYGARCFGQRAVLRNACTWVSDQNACVTSRSMWEVYILLQHLFTADNVAIKILFMDLSQQCFWSASRHFECLRNSVVRNANRRFRLKSCHYGKKESSDRRTSVTVFLTITRNFGL